MGTESTTSAAREASRTAAHADGNVGRGSAERSSVRGAGRTRRTQCRLRRTDAALTRGAPRVRRAAEVSPNVTDGNGVNGFCRAVEVDPREQGRATRRSGGAG